MCECGCGWQGEDEVTQWLVMEAVHMKGIAESVAQTDEEKAMDTLAERHRELTALKERMGNG